VAKNIGNKVIAEFHRSVKELARGIAAEFKGQDDAEKEILRLVAQGNFDELFGSMIGIADLDDEWDVLEDLVVAADKGVDALVAVGTRAKSVDMRETLADYSGALLAAKNIMTSLTWPAGFAIMADDGTND
jgi:hypothetical protein